MKILQSNNNTKHFCNILRSGGAAAGPAFSSPGGAWVRGWVGEGAEGGVESDGSYRDPLQKMGDPGDL